MFKLKSIHYLILLISSLILSILFLNLFISYEVSNLKLTSSQTGAISAIPQTPLPPHYTAIITIAIILAGYFSWVWSKAEELKEKRRN